MEIGFHHGSDFIAARRFHFGTKLWLTGVCAKNELICFNQPILTLYYSTNLRLKTAKKGKKHGFPKGKPCKKSLFFAVVLIQHVGDDLGPDDQVFRAVRYVADIF